MDKTAPQHPGHIGVDLSDHHVGGLRGGQGDINRNPQTHPTEIIRRRNLNQGHMNRQKAAFKQPWNCRHIDGCNKSLVAGDPLGLGRTQVEGSNVNTLSMGFVGNQGERRRLQGHQPDDFDIFKIIRQLRQAPDQMLGLTAGGADKHPLPRLNDFEGLRNFSFVFNIFIRPIQ